MVKTLLLSTSCFLLLSNIAIGQDEELPFIDVTSTHLPASAATSASMDAHVIDIDGDGDLDIIVANEFRPNILMMNDGSGRFRDVSATNIPQPSHDSEDIAVADFDLDGDLDILVVSEDDETNEYYLNDGNGNFEDAGNRIPYGGVTNGVAIADLNSDGAMDVVLGNGSQNVVLINDGHGGFRNETSDRMPANSDTTQDLEFGDIDGDGDLDMLVANENQNRLLINDGSGHFADETDARLPSRAIAEETREGDFGDIDGDGDLDILLANTNFIAGGDPGNRLLINDGSGHFTDETAERLPLDADLNIDRDFHRSRC